MTVKELKETLKALGVPEKDYKDLRKPELEKLVAQKNDKPKQKKKAPTKNNKSKAGKLLQITSKRKDGTNCYWLEDGTKLPWEDLKEYFPKANAISPPHKAKDYAQKVNGEWKLFFRHEVEK